MAYVMAMLLKLEGDDPIAAQEALIASLPENTLYITNPLVLPEDAEECFDIDVHYYPSYDESQKITLESVIGLEMMSWTYSIAYIASRLGLTKDEVTKILETQR